MNTYILNKKRNLTFFSFSVISWFLRNPTYLRSIFIVLVYVHYMHLFFTRLSFQNSLYATVNACFARAQLCISSFACSFIDSRNKCLHNFNFCISIIMLYLSKIRRKLKLILSADVNVDKYVGRSIVIER